MAEVFDAVAPLKPPVQSIMQASYLRDKLEVAIAELIGDYERATRLRVDGVSVSRQTSTNYVGQISSKLAVGVLVRLPATPK